MGVNSKEEAGGHECNYLVKAWVCTVKRLGHPEAWVCIVKGLRYPVDWDYTVKGLWHSEEAGLSSDGLSMLRRKDGSLWD